MARWLDRQWQCTSAEEIVRNSCAAAPRARSRSALVWCCSLPLVVWLLCGETDTHRPHQGPGTAVSSGCNRSWRPWRRRSREGGGGACLIWNGESRRHGFPQLHTQHRREVALSPSGAAGSHTIALHPLALASLSFLFFIVSLPVVHSESRAHAFAVAAAVVNPTKRSFQAEMAFLLTVSWTLSSLPPRIAIGAACRSRFAIRIPVYRVVLTWWLSAQSLHA